MYLGLNLRDNSLMAAKEVPVVGVSAARLHALRREIRLLRSLKHENVVGYLGTVTHGGFVYIFTEWVPGGSLNLVLKRFGKLGLGVVRQYHVWLIVESSFGTCRVCWRDPCGTPSKRAHDPGTLSMGGPP